MERKNVSPHIFRGGICHIKVGFLSFVNYKTRENYFSTLESFYFLGLTFASNFSKVVRKLRVSKDLENVGEKETKWLLFLEFGIRVYSNEKYNKTRKQYGRISMAHEQYVDDMKSSHKFRRLDTCLLPSTQETNKTVP